MQQQTKLESGCAQGIVEHAAAELESRRAHGFVNQTGESGSRVGRGWPERKGTCFGG